MTVRQSLGLLLMLQAASVAMATPALSGPNSPANPYQVSVDYETKAVTANGHPVHGMPRVAAGRPVALQIVHINTLRYDVKISGTNVTFNDKIPSQISSAILGQVPYVSI